MLVVALLALGVLPERIDVKTPVASFAAEHELAVHEGKIYWRPRSGSREWVLLPPAGLPVGHGGRVESLKKTVGLSSAKFDSPPRVDALSADGDNLVAWGSDGRVYYAKLDTLEWTNVWGPTGGTGPLSVAGLDAVAMSHRMVAYEDIDGNSHPVSAGVTTFYALAQQGRSLRYADPWLPPNFERAICLPERGRFIAAALSASASTLFVMDSAGRSFTRLVDFDTQGDDPALPYSWVREKRSGLRKDVRSLPAEDWRAQPPIPGWHSTTITVLQTGLTNAGRELRVEGQNGYWHKAIYDEAWAFEPTGVPAVGKQATGEVAQQPDGTLPLGEGTGLPGATVRLQDFNPLCSPALFEVIAGAEKLSLPLHFHGGLLVVNLPGVKTYRGALLLPPGKTPWLSRLRAVGLSGSHLDVTVEVSEKEVSVKRLPLLNVTFKRR